VMRYCVFFISAALVLQAQDPYRAQRERMVHDQIESRGIKNAQVLRAMRETPRHLFVPPEARQFAYGDHPVPIGYGQTISQPYIVGFMTEVLDVRKEHRVLEIGTGSGYQAAILSPLAKEVHTLEIVPELAKSAAETLKRLGHANVFVREADGYRGWPEKAPFDRIILTAAPPELPQPLVDQLRPGGKLVAPVGSSVFGQEIIVVEKAADGKITKRSMLPVRFVPMVKPAAR
jgi:protein-L-isoaspartate(D-aspartate) O-methyltransferase